MIMKNLANETIDKMTLIGKTAFDVAFVSDGECWCSFDNFIKEAEHFKYDSDYGSIKVNIALRVNFDDGTWLSRTQYDGREWWVYNGQSHKNAFDETTKPRLKN